MTPTLAQKALAEFIGTLALIFIGAGSICANQLSGGGVGLVGIALAHGLVIAAMVSAVGHISGAHLNPAVTIGVWVAQRISTREAALYWAAQLAGGVAGALLLVWVFDAGTRAAVNLGTPALAPGVGPAQGLLFEVVMTFFLVFVVFATAVDPRGAVKMVAGLAIGMVITFDILAGGPVTGASMNPARTFGPAAVAASWQDHWLYWVGPLTGGLLAGALYNSVFLRRAP